MKDFAGARTCYEKYLELSETVSGGHRSPTHAHHTLGDIAGASGDFEVASRHFERAIDRARRVGDKKQEQAAKVGLGVAAGNAVMDEYMRRTAEEMMRVSRKK